MWKVSSPRSTTVFSIAFSGEEALLLQGALELVGDLVEPAAVRAGAPAPGQPDGADQAAVAGGVAAVVGAEHAALDADHLAAVAALAGEVGGGEVLLGVRPSRVACRSRRSPQQPLHLDRRAAP